MTGRGPAPVASTTLSVETLATLATANDLLQKIIVELDLRVEETGRPLAIEELAGMLNSEVETPLLTMTVRGGDPGRLQRIANKWAEVFVQKNSELFATEAARSYDFILVQYEETQDALRKQEEERAQFIGQNPLALLQDERGLKGSDLKQYQDTLLKLSVDLTLQSLAYEETVIHLNELTVDGRWIGLQDRGNATTLRNVAIGSVDGGGVGGGGVGGGTPLTHGGVLASTEQAAVIQAKEQFFTSQQQIKDFQENAQLTQLKQRLLLKRDSLGNYITQLEAAENDVKAQSRTLETLETEIKKQPQLLVLIKAIADPAIWQQLGLNPTAADWERIRKLGLQTEELNPAFTTLTNRIITTRTSIETNRERIVLISRRLEETRTEASSLEEEIADKEGIQLPRLQNELALARAVYDKEQAIYAGLQGQVAELRDTTRQMRARRDEYQKLVKRMASVELRISEFDRQNLALESTFHVLAARLQEARIANAEQAGSIRVVESAVEAQVPLPSGKRLTLPLAAVLGLFLGVGVAMFVHALPPGPPTGSGRASYRTLTACFVMAAWKSLLGIDSRLQLPVCQQSGSQRCLKDSEHTTRGTAGSYRQSEC